MAQSTIISDALMLGGGPVGSAQGQFDTQNADQHGNEVVQLVNDVGNQGRQDQSPQSAFHEVKYTANKEGGFDVAVKMPSTTYDYLGNLLQTGMAAENAFAAARQQLAQKRVFQQENPIIAGIGRIASTAAAQYGSGYQPGRGTDIAPLIRAAGAYGLDQFGQTPDQLAQQEAQLATQQFGVSNQLYNQAQQDQIIKNQEARANRAESNDALRLKLSQAAQLRQQARDGLITPEALPGLKQQLVDSGYSPEAADTLSRGLLSESQAQQRIKDAENKTKLDVEQLRQVGMDKRSAFEQAQMNARVMAAIGTKNEERVQKEADMLELAQGVVNGDATSLKIYGLRSSGADRGKFLAMIKRLDPSLDEAKINARVKAVESLGSTVKGSFGAQLQSIDTFTQHAGEVIPALQQLENKQSPLLNKGINKLKKDYAGDPAVGPVLVAIAQVGKEYETFLNSGFALQEQDRIQVEKLLNGDMNLGQAKAVLQQFLRTAKDRYISMDNQFRRTTTRHLPSDAVSPEARAAAEQLGVPLPDFSQASVDRNAAMAASGTPVARAPQGTPDGPMQYKGKPVVVKDGIIYAQ